MGLKYLNLHGCRLLSDEAIKLFPPSLSVLKLSYCKKLTDYGTSFLFFFA
jgi:hypothetical protein